MVKHGGKLWARHPGVRSGNELSLGERAADGLKAAFGTWTLLFAIVIGIALWITLVHDPGELHLNLGLSFLASVQGVILQIAANRGDRIAGEVSLHTQANTDTLKDQSQEILTLTQQQMDLLAGIESLSARVDLVLRAVIPPASAPFAGGTSPDPVTGSGTAGEATAAARRISRPPRKPKDA